MMCKLYFGAKVRKKSEFLGVVRFLFRNFVRMNQYDTYIFDLDGTLLNTLDDLAAATNYALRSNGLPQHSVDDVRRFVGNGVRMLMRRAVPDGEQNPLFEAAFATFRQYYLAHSLDTTRPYDGVMTMLRSLKSRGCRLAVVSNKFCAATEELCRHFFDGLIEVAIGENEAPTVPSTWATATSTS